MIELLNIAAPSPELSYGWMLFKMLLALLLIVGIAYVVLRVFGKGQRLQLMGMRQSERLVRVLDHCALGPNRGLWVVEIDGRRLLIGAASASVTLLSELEVTHTVKTKQ